MTLETTAGREKKATFSPLTKLSQNYIFTCLKEKKKKQTEKESTMLFISYLDSSTAECKWQMRSGARLFHTASAVIITGRLWWRTALWGWETEKWLLSGGIPRWRLTERRFQRQDRKTAGFWGKVEEEGGFEETMVSRRMWGRLMESMEDWEPEVEFWIGCTYERNWLRIKE